MNFEHWKNLDNAGAGAAAENGDSAANRRIPIDRAYTRMPNGGRRGPRATRIMQSGARPAAVPEPVEVPPSVVQRQFVASDPAPDMDLVFADIDRHLE